MSAVEANSAPARGRNCGSCALCCKLLGIAELNKPMGQWCPNCLKSGGCRIYDTRPNECRTFNCEWLVNAQIGDEWQPLRSKMVMHHVNDGGISKLVIHVDPGSPLSWKSEPYYSQLKRWARNAIETNGLINIYLGKKVIVVLPKKDVDLGTFKLGDRINILKRRTGSDWEVEVQKVSQDARSQ